MDFQDLLAAVLDPGQEPHVIAEHGDGDVGLFLHQERLEPAPVPELFQREQRRFLEEMAAVRRFVIDAQVHHPDGRVHGESRRLAALVGGGDGDVISVADQPVRLVGQHLFHAGGPVGTGDEVEEFHDSESFEITGSLVSHTVSTVRMISMHRSRGILIPVPAFKTRSIPGFPS